MINAQLRTAARGLHDKLEAALKSSGNYEEGWSLPGLSEEEIANQQRRLGVDLPDEYRAVYSVFDGFGEVRIDIHYLNEIFTGFHLNPLGLWRDQEQDDFILHDIVAQQSRSPQPVRSHGSVNAVVYDPRWIALTFPGAWYSWYADFSGAQGSAYGQVICVKSDADATRYDVHVWQKTFLSSSS
jgi:cell wall assembly regulator SMI1